MKFIYFLLLPLLLTGCQFTNYKPADMYFYLDQNNNSYSITPVEIKYNPIAAKNSSSGVYSGGKNATVTITTEQFNSIAQLAEELLQNKEYHATKREMLTAVLSVELDSLVIKKILKKSKNRTEFETALQRILNN